MVDERTEIRVMRQNCQFSRRQWLQRSLLAAALSGVGGRWMGERAGASFDKAGLDAVPEALDQAVQSGLMKAAVMLVRHGDHEQAWAFGQSIQTDSVFLLASITKPMVAAVVMTLCDQGEIRLDDPVQSYLPEFSGDGRQRVTLRHLLSHCSGLPDQLPDNSQLRSRHAGMEEFVRGATRLPLAFLPGSKFLYSSMGILLASEVAERISGKPMASLIQERLFGPLGMQTASLGTGGRSLQELVPCQTEYAAAEAGSGKVDTRSWDWNSLYWRQFGAPWGGAHGSAGDVAKFFAHFLFPGGQVLKPATATEMVTRQFAPAVTSRGLGFGVGRSNSSRYCSGDTWGHTGSTGTLAWADPKSKAICVVLTTLPGNAVDPHPRQLASDAFAKWIGRT
jgi:CubicO group peptidase (beta-lactamase class C family)